MSSDSAPAVVPLEATEATAWIVRCRRTVAAMLRRPGTTFAMCPEPIDHGRVLRFLATLRLPAWVVLLVTLFALRWSDGPEVAPMRAIYGFAEPELVQVLSTWVLLMVPVGLPLLYFLGGLLAHVGIALTGGASRSIGASMRAVGYALGPPLLALGVIDVPLYLGSIDGMAYLAVLGALALAFLWWAAFALARTHQISLARGFLVGVLPTLLLVTTTAARAALELEHVPGLPPPPEGSPYYVPGP